MNVRRPILLLAALGTASVLAACGGSSGGGSSTQANLPGDSVAVVDGKPILKKDFDHLITVGLAALIATRLLQRATVAIARRIRRRAHSHHGVRAPWHDIADQRPPRVELLRPAGRGPPAFAVA